MGAVRKEFDRSPSRGDHNILDVSIKQVLLSTIAFWEGDMDWESQVEVEERYQRYTHTRKGSQQHTNGLYPSFIFQVTKNFEKVNESSDFSISEMYKSIRLFYDDLLLLSTAIPPGFDFCEQQLQASACRGVGIPQPGSVPEEKGTGNVGV
ncbi:hypothetical protein EK904_012284 [Melospiza melodia maxima]|nr:hypothetical protein EK904_012284 [Melospiza melodia maxima]